MRAIPRKLTLSLLLALLSCAPALAQGKHMQLLAPDVGWVLGADKLYWTTDGGGQWANITPPMSLPREKIADLFFKDAINGWALLSAQEGDTDEWRFEIASTVNSGTTWSVRPIEIPDFNPRSMILGGGGQVDFVDSSHGWVELGVASGSNFRMAIHLATQDGGATWTRQAPGAAGTIHFTTANDGWLAGGPTNNELRVTHDGGKTWQALSLKSPAELRSAIRPVYDVPVFRDAQHGLIPVKYAIKVPQHSSSWSVVLFATDDGGRTWKANGALNLGEHGEYDAPIAVCGSVLLAATVGERTVTIRSLPLGGSPAATSAPAPSLRAALELSFATTAQGWVWGGMLLATSDGGATWTDVTPWRPKAGVAVEQPAGGWIGRGKPLALFGSAGGWRRWRPHPHEHSHGLR